MVARRFVSDMCENGSIKGSLWRWRARMQTTTRNMASLWRPVDRCFMRKGEDGQHMQQDKRGPLILPGRLCFSRRKLRGEEYEEDELEDGMLRTNVYFDANCYFKRGYDEDGVEDMPYIEHYYSLAGVALTGESTGNPMMALTHAKSGFVNFVNTGTDPISAGEDVYFMWPEGSGVALTVGKTKFETHLMTLHQDGVEKSTYIARHFVGRCMLGADVGQMGTVLLS